jgi:hypothetical protein
MFRLLLLLVASLLATTLFAQAPQSINYQGAARSLTGAALENQTIGLRIAIRQGSVDGQIAYQETHTTTTNGLGIFSLRIGSGGVVTGSFEQIDWGGSSHFLEIELDEAGGADYQLIGTSELLSVPYSLYAQDAEDAQNAENAVNAENAQNAVSAQTADSAVNAQKATTAETAMTAQHALRADTATYAFFAENGSKWEEYSKSFQSGINRFFDRGLR